MHAALHDADHLLEWDVCAGIFDDLQTLANATDTRERANAAIAAARTELASLPTPPTRKRLALLEWVDPAYSPGHWVPEQIEAAGFESVLGGPGDHSRAMHWSEVMEAKPDAVGIICCGFGLEDNAGFAETVRSSDAALGGFDGPIVAFDANRFFSRPTLSVVDGAGAYTTPSVQRRHPAMASGE